MSKHIDEDEREPEWDVEYFIELYDMYGLNFAYDYFIKYEYRIISEMINRVDDDYIGRYCIEILEQIDRDIEGELIGLMDCTTNGKGQIYIIKRLARNPTRVNMDIIIQTFKNSEFIVQEVAEETLIFLGMKCINQVWDEYQEVRENHIDDSIDSLLERLERIISSINPGKFAETIDGKDILYTGVGPEFCPECHSHLIRWGEYEIYCSACNRIYPIEGDNMIPD